MLPIEPDETEAISEAGTRVPVALSSAGRRLALNTVIVGAAFVLSRMLGLVREAVIASQFGTSEQIDAYIAAFRVPDTLFLLIVGGAVGSAFIPVFTGLMTKSGKSGVRSQESATDTRHPTPDTQAWQLASTLINFTVVLLSIGGIVMALIAPALVANVIAPGITDPQLQATVVDLTRILLLSPLFMGLGGWTMGILNARQHFTLPAFAPVVYNLAIIGGALFLAPSMGVYGLAWSVVIGSMLHFAIQVPGLRGVGMKYFPFRINLRDEGTGEVGRLLLPRVIGQAAFQINIIAMTALASFLAAGSIAAFNYAYVLMMLPHGVFAMSLATVTFPTMAAQYAENNLDALRHTLARAVRVLLFLTIPSAVGLFFLRTEIVAALFQLGAFGRYSTEMVASALAYFALGLVAYAVVEVITRAFYAMHDTATPVAIAVGTVVLNLGLSVALTRGLGWGLDGLALSLAVTTTIEMILLWVLLGRKLPSWRLSAEGMLPSIAKSAAAAAAMGLALALLMPPLQNFIPPAQAGKLGTILLAALGVAIGSLVYIVAARLLRSEELEEASGLVLRRIRKRRS